MPAGTIALTNNSATVTGTGTSFTTELKVNDFLVSTIGGLAYTLGVKSIESNTSLTLIEKYTGPAATGQAWTPVPYGTMAAITAQLAAQVTYAIRGLNLDKANWQKIFSNDQSVTVNLPDLNTFTGPGWGYISTKFTSLGDAAYKNTGTSAGTLAAGDDSRLSTVDKKSGGTLSSNTYVTASSAPNTYYSPGFNAVNSQRGGSSGQVNSGGVMTSQIVSTALQATFSVRELVGNSTYALIQCIQGGNTWDFRFQNNGNAYASGTWTNGSDKRFKSNLKVIAGALEKVKSLTGYTGKRDGMAFTGLLAQDLQEVLPEAVFNTGPYTLKNNVNDYKKGDVIPDALGVAYGDTVGLLVESIKELSELVEARDSVINEVLKRMKAIDGLGA